MLSSLLRPNHGRNLQHIERSHSRSVVINRRIHGYRFSRPISFPYRCVIREMDSRVSISRREKNTRPPRAHTVSTGPRYFHVSVRSASTNIGDHRGKPRQRRMERKATRSGEREREREGRDGFFSFCTYTILNGHPPFSRSNHALVRRLIRAKRVLKNWSIGVRTRIFSTIYVLCFYQYRNRGGFRGEKGIIRRE